MMGPMLVIALLSMAPALGLTCEAYLPPEVLEPVIDSPIVEASGLARSRTRPGVWFTHNDAGGAAELYAFSLDGSFLETHPVQGAEFRDWEDLAAGPCPDGRGGCLYIGDIGDNARARETVVVYAVREPASGAAAVVLATWELRYPDGVAQDSEALFVHPRSGRIYLATKDHDSDTSAVYRLPGAPSDQPVDLELVHSWRLEGQSAATTGGAWDPDGDRLAIRTYSSVFEWRTDPCDEGAHWGLAPSVQPVGDSRGEAIAYDELGGLVAVTEGERMEITLLACADPEQGSRACDTGDMDSATPLDRDSGSGREGPGADEPLSAERGCGGCGGRAVSPWAGLPLALWLVLGPRRRLAGGGWAGRGGAPAT
jgi:hypothetical protein